jgi:hypothetical protein
VGVDGRKGLFFRWWTVAVHVVGKLAVSDETFRSYGRKLGWD